MDARIKRPLVFLLLLFLALAGLLSGCDTRRPMDGEDDLGKPPILEFSADQEAISAAKDTFITVRALLVNANHGTLTNRRIDFQARVGFIVTHDSTNDSGIANAFYYTRVQGLARPVNDTLIASFEYQGPDGETSVRDTLVLRLIPGGTGTADSVGSLELSASRTAVQVRGTGNNDQAMIAARVFDALGNPMKDGTKVSFRLLRGPGGGEALGQGLTDTASTRSGVATVTFRSGTRIGVVEFEAVSMGQTARQALLTVTSGPPERLNIMVRPESTVTAGNRWRMQVQAVLTDLYLNPVKDSIGVLFTLDPKRADPASISIQGSGITGNTRCGDTTEAECRSVPGSAFTYIAYRSEVIFDSLAVTAETVTGNRTITGTRAFVAPLQKAQVRVNYYGGAVFAPPFQDPDTIAVIGSLADGFGMAIPAARLCISTDGGVVLDTCRLTDAAGKATFRMTVSDRDQTSLALSRVINVMLTEQSTGALGLTSFLAIFN